MSARAVVALVISWGLLAPGSALGANFIEGRVVAQKEGTVEAGVWVIAETTDLPTHYRKIVVTDAYGRFVVPDPQRILSGR